MSDSRNIKDYEEDMMKTHQQALNERKKYDYYNAKQKINDKMDQADKNWQIRDDGCKKAYLGYMRESLWGNKTFIPGIYNKCEVTKSQNDCKKSALEELSQCYVNNDQEWRELTHQITTESMTLDTEFCKNHYRGKKK